MADIVEKKLAKKLKLLNAAEELFEQQGVNITAIDEIVKKAGIAKGTFYLYFRDKYDLLDQIVIYKSEGVIRRAVNKFRNYNGDFPEKVIYLFDCIIDYFVKNRKMLSLIEKNLSSCLRMVISGEYMADNEIMKPVFDEFTANGFNREETLKKVYIITSIVSSLCYDAVIYSKPYTVEQIKSEIHYIIRSLLNEGGSENGI